ncbi:MAG TPA: diguanylate cyclase [Deltaproteobacteria bacterium]|nr:diguanylate cyclase [Deltaproteobacteria bacterium]
MKLLVKRLPVPFTVDADWSNPVWREIPAVLIGNYMGEKPGHLPKTEAKIAYEETAICLMFRVEDRYVRAVAEEHQDTVCGDSCVEFFFTPGPDVSKGYFNLEMNCGGTILFHFNSTPRAGIEISEDDCERIVKTHSLPRIVDPEIKESLTWSVACSIPLDLLSKYCPVDRPKRGGLWRANFYKCGDHTSHPHWLTWSPVDYPKPNFHLPESFGLLEFE